MLVQAFISSRIDYCNSLLYGVADGLVAKLQAIQNVAARLVTGTRKYNHVSPVLRSLHWLPVRHRVTFKLAVLVYKSLHALSPSYLACLKRRHAQLLTAADLGLPSSSTPLFFPTLIWKLAQKPAATVAFRQMQTFYQNCIFFTENHDLIISQ